MKRNKNLKFAFGIIVFLTLPSFLFFGFLYFKYHEDLPLGKEGEKAELLASKMLESLNYEAFKSTNYIEWTYKNRRHYKWQKDQNSCTVYWKEFKTILNLKDYSSSKAYVHNFEVKGEQAEKLINESVDHFNNDSFWLVAPYKIYDKGVERRFVKDEKGKDALLVTYTSGGTTPGDSYLWYLDNDGRPTKFKMWVSSLPIDGLEATWTDWITTESGAQLPTNHNVLFLNFDMGEVKGSL